MFCTVKIKLLTTIEQHSKLINTMKAFNSACNYISDIVFNNKIFGKIKLQQNCYYDVREKFNLSAQMAVRAIGKVSESYKTNKKHLHTFKPTGAMVYDERILSFKGVNIASILTIHGRIKVNMLISEYHKGVLQGKRVRGQADLILQNNVFYLLLVVEFPEHDIIPPSNFIGIDLGIKNIATDSTGNNYSGSKVNNIRKRHFKLRKKLQSKGTKSAKRLLKKRSSKEKLFARDVNHCISKSIVAMAKALGFGIALEDLKGIHERVTVIHKSQRRQHNSWSFYQLRQFIEYKAAIAGIPIVLVNPRNTSRTCPACGYISKSNRPNRDTFCCQKCNFSGAADNIAAENIRRAAVNQPNVATVI